MKRNKRTVMRMLCFTLAFIVGIGFTAMVTIDPAAAAPKKKTVYVVKSIKVTEKGKTTTTKIKYNKNGTLKKVYDPREQETMTFKYGKKGRIKSFQDAYPKYNHVEKRDYTWKKGKLIKLTGTRTGGDTYTMTFKNKKGKIVSRKDVEKWINDDGSIGTRTQDSKFKYKKGHITRIDYVDKAEGETFKSTTYQKLDKKGNVISIYTYDSGQPVGGYYKAKIKYKKGRVSTMKTEEWIPPYQEYTPKLTKKITYKKIKVKTSLVKKVKAQQWKLINKSNVLEDLAW